MFNFKILLLRWDHGARIWHWNLMFFISNTIIYFQLHPNTVHITAVVVQYKTSSGRVNDGVATSWLSKMRPVDGEDTPVVPIYIRKSQFRFVILIQLRFKFHQNWHHFVFRLIFIGETYFSDGRLEILIHQFVLFPLLIAPRNSLHLFFNRLPVRSQIPIIMIGPGTGLAPFRGFIQERDLAKKEDKQLGDTILYFGCRHKEQDFLYKEVSIRKSESDIFLITLYSISF